MIKEWVAVKLGSIADLQLLWRHVLCPAIRHYGRDLLWSCVYDVAAFVVAELVVERVHERLCVCEEAAADLQPECCPCLAATCEVLLEVCNPDERLGPVHGVGSCLSLADHQPKSHLRLARCCGLGSKYSHNGHGCWAKLAGRCCESRPCRARGRKV